LKIQEHAMNHKSTAASPLTVFAAAVATIGSTAPVAGKTKKDTVAEHHKTFDTLDFDVFSNQKWDRLHESHSDDIAFVWPDGHETKGIAKHIKNMKRMFVYAPNTSIKAHPVEFGSGDWTLVIGVMTGTFSRPMPMPGGESIPPTRKSFKIPVATIGHWRDGKMDKEYMFWDNQSFMKQIGVVRASPRGNDYAQGVTRLKM
jgi:hypothetical protein